MMIAAREALKGTVPASMARIFGRRTIRIRTAPALAVTFFAVVLALAALAAGGCTRPVQQANGTQSTGNIASDAVAGAGQNIHSSLEAGKKTECQSNLQQLRSAIQMQKDSEGAFPAALADLGPNLRSIESCPSSNQPYRYDPATGRVWCTTPGHERL